MFTRTLAGALALACIAALVVTGAEARPRHHYANGLGTKNKISLPGSFSGPMTCDTDGRCKNGGSLPEFSSLLPTISSTLHRIINDARPRAWCGWYARHELVSHDPGIAFNLARNWAHWGRPASPGPGVMVVWPHHVGMITGRAGDGQWIVKSGNDGGGQVRERRRSISGAIAFRRG